MIDIKDLRANPEPYIQSAKARGLQVNTDRLLKLDAERTGLVGEVDTLRAKLNLKGKPSSEQLKELQNTKAELEIKEVALNTVEIEFQDLLSQVPNLLAPDTPEGGEEAARQESKWGEPQKTAVKDHQTLAEEHDWLDFERGAKVAGNKFYFAKGALVKLEQAVLRLAMNHLEKAGFTLMSVPHLVTGKILDGTGFQPRGEEEQSYKAQDEDLYLIGTAEIPLTGYHADEILDPAKLPLVYAGLSPAYRKEAGSYGKYSKGLYRVHQFNKLEMYVYCLPEDSEQWHQKLVKIEEDICQQLAIPYRVVRIAAGDLGAPAYKKYDLEYWSPVETEYRELMSCSNVTDYQARRLQIRTRDNEGKTIFVHTLNGTAVAFSRVAIALLENHQTPEGQVKLPPTLAKIYGGDVL